MNNLIPTATIILAEISVVLLVLLGVLGFRYLRRSRQHRREIETLMDMARDSRVALPGRQGAVRPARSAVENEARTAATDDRAASNDTLGASTAGVPDDGEAAERLKAAATPAVHSDETAQGGPPAPDAAAVPGAHAPVAPLRGVPAAAGWPQEHEPVPPVPASAQGGPGPATADDESTDHPTPGVGIRDVETLHRVVTALEGRVLQAHRDHLQLAGRIRRAMDRVTEDVGAVRRDMARLADRLLADAPPAPQPGTAPRGRVADGYDDGMRASFDPGPVYPDPGPTMDLTGHTFGEAPPRGPGVAIPPSATPAAPRGERTQEKARARHDATTSGAADWSAPDARVQDEDDPAPHDNFLQQDRARAAGAPASMPPPPVRETRADDDAPAVRDPAAVGTGAVDDDDPDYILDSETLQRLLGPDAVPASAPGSGIDVEEISLSDFGPEHIAASPAQPGQPFTSHQDSVFFQSSSTSELEQGWYITVAGEPPQGPFSDKQTAERVLAEVRGHTAGRSAQGGG